VTGGETHEVLATSLIATDPMKLTQFAFVIREPESVSYFWKRLGFPEFEFTQVPLRDLVFRGRPGRVNQQLAWQRHGRVAYEWCVPLSGLTVHQEHLQRHGEGLHHLGFEVDDIDRALAAWKAQGIAAVQSGAWGEAGKAGSGRFAYLDTDFMGGVTIELLWNHK